MRLDQEGACCVLRRVEEYVRGVSVGWGRARTTRKLRRASGVASVASVASVMSVESMASAVVGPYRVLFDPRGRESFWDDKGNE